MRTMGQWKRLDAGQRTFVTDNEGKPIVEMSIRADWRESESNANLIVAAPLLLEALRVLMKMPNCKCGMPDCHECFLDGQAYQLAEDAIKKAEGNEE